MKKYYFTFGHGHVTNDGVNMLNYYVTVHAESYGEARKKFVEQFTMHEMSAPDKFAFQYEDGKFDKERWCPLGEYRAIN